MDKKRTFFGLRGILSKRKIKFYGLKKFENEEMVLYFKK